MKPDSYDTFVFVILALCVVFLFAIGATLISAGKHEKVLKWCESAKSERYWGGWVLAAASLFALVLPFMYRAIFLW